MPTEEIAREFGFVGGPADGMRLWVATGLAEWWVAPTHDGGWLGNSEPAAAARVEHPFERYVLVGGEFVHDPWFRVAVVNGRLA